MKETIKMTKRAFLVLIVSSNYKGGYVFRGWRSRNAPRQRSLESGGRVGPHKPNHTANYKDLSACVASVHARVYGYRCGCCPHK